MVVPERELPLIDLSQSDSSVVEQLDEVYRTLGFAGLVNHGADRALLDAAFEASRRFHALPTEAKHAIELNDSHRGFIAQGTSTDAASEYEEITQPNQSESFMMLGPIPQGRFLDGPNQWPELEGFRAAIEAYHAEATQLARRVIGLFAAVLDAPLADHFEMPTAWLRLLRYPPQSDQASTYGSAPHRDYGAITLLAQDGVAGLEVLTPEGTWLDVPGDTDMLVLNLGEVMHRWSNGSLLRTPHRVRNRSNGERYSMPFFFDPDMRSTIEPMASCVPAGQAPAFEPVSFEDFVRGELTAGYDRHAAS